MAPQRRRGGSGGGGRAPAQPGNTCNKKTVKSMLRSDRNKNKNKLKIIRVPGTTFGTPPAGCFGSGLTMTTKIAFVCRIERKNSLYGVF